MTAAHPPAGAPDLREGPRPRLVTVVPLPPWRWEEAKLTRRYYRAQGYQVRTFTRHIRADGVRLAFRVLVVRDPAQVVGS